MSNPDDPGAAAAADGTPAPAKTLPHIDLPPPNAKDRRNSASRLDLKSLPQDAPASPPDEGVSPRDRSPSARGRASDGAEALEAHRQVPAPPARCRLLCSLVAAVAKTEHYSRHDAAPLFAHVGSSPRLSRAAQAIQSWSEEFKVQLASGGADPAEEEGDEGAEEEDDAEEAQALLDFAEAIEHR
jgi:hypothetical protein